MPEKKLEKSEFKTPPAISSEEYTHSGKNIEIKDGKVEFVDNKSTNKEKEVDKFKDKAEEILIPIIKNARAQGIRIGMLSCSKIVMDKLNDKSKSLIDRITDVKNFCNVAIKNDKFLDGVASEDEDDVDE
jgi:hypothetical protein